MSTTFVAATYNIQFGRGRDGRIDLGRIVDAVRPADVIAWQEVEQNWTRSGGIDQAADIAERLNQYYVFGSGFDVDASRVREDGRLENRRRRFGNMVSSRWPIRSTRTLLLPKRPLHVGYDVYRSATEAVVEAPFGAFRVYSLHLSHVSPGQRVPQARAFVDLLGAAPLNGSAWDGTYEEEWTEGQPTPILPVRALVMGDLNCTAASHEYAVFCGERTDKGVRLTPADGLIDLWVAAGHGELEGRSFLKDGTKIDHILGTPDMADLVSRAWIDEQAAGSDHQPLFVELRR